MKSRRRPLSDDFPVIPMQVGIQGFQSLVLDPRFRGGDEIRPMTGFSHGLGRLRSIPYVGKSAAVAGQRPFAIGVSSVPPREPATTDNTVTHLQIDSDQGRIPL